MKKLFCLTIILVVVLFCRCTTTRITNSWKSTSANVSRYQKILVTALIHNADSAMQQSMESHIVGDITSLGYDAVSCYKLYGSAPFQNMDEKSVINKLHSSGIDAILTIILLDKSKDSYDVISNLLPSMYPYDMNNFWDYYSVMYNHLSDPGYYQEHTMWYWESNLYDARSTTRIYSVQTASFDPSSAERFSHRYGKMIVRDMVKNKILHSH